MTNIPNIVQTARAFYDSGETRSLEFRIRNLRKLQDMIVKHEKDILEALEKDMGRPAVEAYLGDVDIVLAEVKYALKHVRSWTKPRRVKTSSFHFLASSYIYPEPLGVAFIVSAWNFPFQQLFVPLAGAIAAGNCAVLKPSELSSHSAELIERIVKETFDPEYITVVTGGVPETQELLAQKFDHIFFTGSTRVGKIFMEAAAKHLTPVTLELGGANPTIVEKDTDIKKTARRIVWAKFFNTGQICTAPNHLYVHKDIKDELMQELKNTVEEFYGNDPSNSSDVGRILNDMHFARISEHLKEGDVVIGGATDPKTRFIAPTILDNVSPDAVCMQEEIFGPILPVRSYESLNDLLDSFKDRPKPLAIYFFSKNKAQQEKVIRETSSGGVTINDAMIHGASRTLPYSGVGESGMGAYHGKTTFDTFTHYKSVMKKSFLFDFPIRYAPYKGKLETIKRLSRFSS